MTDTHHHPRHRSAGIAFTKVVVTWLFLIGAGGWLYLKSSPQPVAHTVAQSYITGMAEVIDGDGLILKGNEIRLHGIDAFEYDQTCGTYPCGQASKAGLQKLIKGKTVTCWPRDTDRFGRMVAICKAGQTDLAAEQVKTGLALAYSRYSDIYVSLEKAARDQRRGAWAYGFQSPKDYRH